MDETNNSLSLDDKLNKEASQLAAVLKEMKDGLDTVRGKVEALTAKVKADQFPTADGMSYLEAKHLLLLNYCQSIVYYLLRKAKGFSIEGHPVVQSLVEIRLFLEKIRSIDKKLQYQIQKLTRAGETAAHEINRDEKGTNASQKKEDPLKYRPNPNMLISKENATAEDGVGVYRPPKFAPATMKEDKASKQKLRKEKEALRHAMRNPYTRGLLEDVEGRPEEIRDSIVGAESRELTKFMEKAEKRAREEEELFNRAPITKKEKKTAKHLEKSRNGLLGMTDNFYDEIRNLPMEEDEHDQMPAIGSSASGPFGRRGKHKKHKRRH